MKFKITSFTDDGKIRVDVYDNITNDVFDGFGNKLDLTGANTGISFSGTDEPLHDKSIFHAKKRRLHKLKIQLGFKCNFNCAYCAQRAYENQIPIHSDTPAFVPGFLDKISKNIESVEEILFMGGEPFVYIKLLRPLVQGLRKLFPDVRMHTITNASLLDTKMADWCVDNKINLTISHDGPTFSKYRDDKDIFKNSEVIKGIQHYVDRSEREGLNLFCCINVVVYPENCRLGSLPAFFDEKIGRKIRIQFESIVKLNEATVNGVEAFDGESSNILLSEMFKGGIDKTGDNQLICLHDFGKRVARRIAGNTNLENIHFYCDNSRDDIMSVDLAGRLLVCQAYPYTRTGYGQIEEMTQATSDIPKSWVSKSDCAKCPFLVSCLGGCPLQSGNAQEISCKNLKIWHMGFFLIAWHHLFHTTIAQIEPVE